MIYDIDELKNMGYDQAYWYFNINKEQEWNMNKEFPSVFDPHQIELVKQQEQQMILLAKSNDIIISTSLPDEDFLNYLKQRGVSIPDFQKVQSIFSTSFSERESILVPYINTNTIIRNFQEKIKIFGCNNASLVMDINNKFFVRNLAKKHKFRITKGSFCYNVDQLTFAYRALKNDGFNKVVIKIPYSSSGKGLYIIENEKSFSMILKFIEKRSKNKFHLLIEGWYEPRTSISAQLLIKHNRVHLLSITEQFIDKYGVYRGTNFTPQLDNKKISEYEYELFRIGSILMEIGYQGVIGVDSIIDQSGILYPLIEINARFTQVTYLLPTVQKFLRKHKFIESTFVDFEQQNNITFDSIYRTIKEKLRSDNFLIYVFANHQIDNKTKFRVFVLFYANDYNSIRNMRHKLSVVF